MRGARRALPVAAAVPDQPLLLPVGAGDAGLHVHVPLAR